MSKKKTNEVYQSYLSRALTPADLDPLVFGQNEKSEVTIHLAGMLKEHMPIAKQYALENDINISQFHTAILESIAKLIEDDVIANLRKK